MLRRMTSAASSAFLLICIPALAAGSANLWLDVPFVPQQKDGCGAAGVAMVMQYWEQHQGRSVQPEANPARILRALYAPTAHGIYASAMVRYFQQNGYRAFAFAGQTADLERELAQGRPLLVALRPGSGASLHYVVVAGLDQPQQLVLINDPAQRKLLKKDISQFEREWNAAGRWTLLAVPETSSH
ncbi:Peptidase, C39 family [Candidatus Sulfotelmatomonas gaucii]|uniref:Peptidase, C39 family n=1 Tax=Candidatus Sulfuritelmatomonas gaucii TaxID=2043161 RepID=A0A2N9LAU1_9BACT|nr:Peptidase, C39 family [Candidatus Sulfotelmatomonas gaucii]